MQIAHIQAYSYECTPCSDAISGPKNRVFDIKSGHDFCRYRNSIQVIYFQISGLYTSAVFLRMREISGKKDGGKITEWIKKPLTIDDEIDEFSGKRF